MDGKQAERLIVAVERLADQAEASAVNLERIGDQLGELLDQFGDFQVIMEQIKESMP